MKLLSIRKVIPDAYNNKRHKYGYLMNIISVIEKDTATLVTKKFLSAKEKSLLRGKNSFMEGKNSFLKGRNSFKRKEKNFFHWEGIGVF